MPFDTTLTKEMNYVFGRGVCSFAPFDDNGVAMGERDLGNVPGLTLTVESEKAEHFSSRTGLRLKDLTLTTSVAFNGACTIEDLSGANLALMLGGAVSTKTQAATPVANERIRNLQGDRTYQLGASGSNPSGVRGVGSVAVSVYEFENAVARVNSTAYVVGDIFKSGTDVFLVTTAGTTAASPPSFDTDPVGAPTTDGTAVVKFLGITGAYTAGDTDTSDYGLSTESARVRIPVAGDIGLAADLYTEVTDLYLSLNVDYTPQANTREQVTSAAVGAISGQFRFIADNANGDNRDLFLPSCTLSPGGDVPFITEDEVASFELAIGVNELDTSTRHVYIEGRPV